MQFLKNLQSKILTTPETATFAPETALATSVATAEKNIYPVVFKTIEESQNETVKSVLNILIQNQDGTGPVEPNILKSRIQEIVNTTLEDPKDNAELLEGFAPLIKFLLENAELSEVKVADKSQTNVKQIDKDALKEMLMYASLASILAFVMIYLDHFAK